MLREFLYVDITRTRSLVGQLDRGVVESVVERSAHGLGTDLFSLVGLGGVRKREETAEISQTRSVDDILFVAFEEVLAEGLIRDIDVSDPKVWQDSTVHADLEVGELVRLQSDVLILDPVFLRDRLDRFVAVAEAVAGIQRGAVDAQLATASGEHDAEIARRLQDVPRDRRKNEERRIRKEVQDLVRAAADAAVSASTLSTDQVKPVADVLNAFFTSDAITVRVLPCGRDQPTYSFVGSLLGRDEYIQRERDALFSRYGSIITGWTCVLQVAAVVSEAEAAAARSMDFTGLNLAPGGTIDRAGMERASLDLLAMMDSLGISEGPRWPSVSVIPLGIYRPVPRSIWGAPAALPAAN